jgi:hypothetical protein
MRVSRPDCVSVLVEAGLATSPGPEYARGRLSRVATVNGGLHSLRRSNRISRIDGFRTRIVLRNTRSIK